MTEQRLTCDDYDPGTLSHPHEPQSSRRMLLQRDPSNSSTRTGRFDDLHDLRDQPEGTNRGRNSTQDVPATWGWTCGRLAGNEVAITGIYARSLNCRALERKVWRQLRQSRGR